jgi:general secretion pathway protein L
MSVLAIQLPPRPRLGARLAAAPADGSLPRLPAEWAFVFSADGRGVTQSGSAAPALLPRADRVVLVLAEAEVSWHRIEIPRAPPARLRAALLGVMEEALLDDDEALHFALAPGAAPGQTGWIAVTQRPYLVAALAAIEASGLSVERVVAASTPGEAAHGHFFSPEPGAEAAPWLSLAGPEGVCCLRLAGALARAVQPPADVAVRWTATPAAAAAAERWLGAPVALLTEAERVLESAATAGNLRQFDLAARHRGSRALRDIGQQFWSREWRPVRAGVVALLALQLVGLNAYAWKQRQALETRRTAMNELLKASHPGVRAVLDAPLQMQRETERLRVAAGRPGEADLEALLGAAAAAWPEGQGPVQTLRFETGRLTLTAPGWGEPQMAQFRERLRSTGFVAELAEGRIIVSRPAPAAKGAA